MLSFSSKKNDDFSLEPEALEPFLPSSDYDNYEEEQTRQRKANRKNFWIHVSILLFVLFVSESTRGIVIPSLALYIRSLGRDDFFLGMVVAGYSFG